MKFKRILLIIFVCFLTLVISACSLRTIITGTSDKGNAEQNYSSSINDDKNKYKKTTTVGLRYALVVKNFYNPYWLYLVEGMKQYCEENGIVLHVSATENEKDYEGQLIICERLLGQNYDAIFVTPLGNVTICPFIKKCNDLDQPIFILDSAADIGTLISLDAKPTSTFEADNYTAGCVAAEYLIDSLDGGGNIVVLLGNMDSEAAIQIRYGMFDTLEGSTQINVIDIIEANWDRKISFEAIKELLSTNQDIDGILASNDEMGLGALEAVTKAGRLYDISIVSINFMEEVQEAIKQGKIYASIDKGSYNQGAMAAEMATKYLLGEQIQDYYQIPVKGYTAEDF